MGGARGAAISIVASLRRERFAGRRCVLIMGDYSLIRRGILSSLWRGELVERFGLGGRASVKDDARTCFVRHSLYLSYSWSCAGAPGRPPMKLKNAFRV